jgi:hypothetical protein
LEEQGVQLEHHTPGIKQQPIIAKTWRYAIYLAAIGILFALTLAETVSPKPENPGAEWYAKIFSWDFWYQVNVTNEFRAPKAKNVTMVIIGQDEPKEVRTDMCRQRVFMAKLLRVLRGAQPAVIVIDKYFMPDACGDSNSTAQLQQAMIEVSQEVPIVFGRWAYYEEELRTTAPAGFVLVKNRGFKDTEVILKETVAFQTVNPSRITTGLVTVDSDTRQVPLLWPAYKDFESVGTKEGPTLTDTLPIATMKVLHPDAPLVSELNYLQQHEREYRRHNPFIGFIREEQFPIRSALGLVCANSQQSKDWEKCQPSNEDNGRFGELRHQVILIGQAGPGLDLHETVVGTVPGIVIQANYIESLLDGRIFRPVTRMLQLAIALVWFMIIERISHRWAAQPGRAIVYPLVATTVLLVIIHEVVILRLGYYMEVMFPGIITVVGVNLGQQVERILTDR